MQRTLFIPLIGLTLVTLACSLTSSLAAPLPTTLPPTQLPAEMPTAAVHLEATQTLAAQPTLVETIPPPTSTITPLPQTNLPVIVNPAPENTATAVPAPLSFIETFDQPNDHWSDPVIVTSQASGRDPFEKVTLESGRLRFALQDKETYVYKFFKPTLQSQTSIQVTYEYRTLANNGVALVCMADPEMTTWYEARLIAEESKYNLYQYHKREKDDTANPYTLLSQGILTSKEFSSVRSNLVTFTCSKDELKLDLNQGLKVITQAVTDRLKGSQVGIGVMSFNSLPVNIDFKTVEIQSHN
jgi:hypothetical protein